MRQGTKLLWLAALTALVCLGACSSSSDQQAALEAPPAPSMPAEWKIVSDWEVPGDQVGSISAKLNATLSSLRNTVYDVNGQRVQLNVLIAPDAASADKLMATLRTMKAEKAFLQKGAIIYEFVGTNDVLPLIAEGRRHLDTL